MDWPSKATFVTPEEKELVTARLKADSDAMADESISWKTISAGMKDYKVWLYGACFHTLSLPLYTLSMFMVFHLRLSRVDHRLLTINPQPSIIKDLGYSAARAQLLTIPPYVRSSPLKHCAPPIQDQTN